MKCLNSFVFLSLIFFSNSAVFAQEKMPDELRLRSLIARPISLGELIANPQKYNGKEVAVDCFIVHDPGRSCLFSTRDEADHYMHGCQVDLRTIEPGPWTDLTEDGIDKTLQLRWAKCWDSPHPWPSKSFGCYGNVIGTFRDCKNRTFMVEQAWYVFEYKTKAQKELNR